MTNSVLYCFFFTGEGEISRIVIPKCTSITGQYYRVIILPKVIKDFHQHHQGRLIRFHDDNAPPHRCQSVLDFLENQVVRVPHPPYSPDLAPCDFWLFSKIKSELRRQCFFSRQSLGENIGMVMQTITVENYANCFNSWKERLQLRINNNGN